MYLFEGNPTTYLTYASLINDPDGPAAEKITTGGTTGEAKVATPCRYQKNHSDFCKNGGECPNNFFSVNCLCPLLFSGTQCEKKITKGEPTINCMECPFGTAQVAEGQAQCDQCLHGYYQSKTKQRECLLCPKGQWTNESKAATCKLCSKGKALAIVGQKIDTCVRFLILIFFFYSLHSFLCGGENICL